MQLKLGDVVSTETYAETISESGWRNVSGVRFVSGTIIKIKGDTVWIDCDGEIICTLADQCWR